MSVMFAVLKYSSHSVEVIPNLSCALHLARTILMVHTWISNSEDARFSSNLL